MGREIKRVALDFDYPINQMIWKGYSNPYSGLKCGVCDGTGQSQEIKQLSEDWYGSERPEKRWCYSITQDEVQALIDENRLWDFTRTPRNEEQRETVRLEIESGKNSWLPENNGYIPTAKEVNDWARSAFGHDSINKWKCVEARAKRMGITEMECGTCKGAGNLWPDEKYAKLADEFEWIEPPQGDGYQLWSTTTEGTPMSPVFSSPESLARWLTDNKASTFGRSTADYETWLKFICGSGWAPSMIATNQKLESGVSAVSV